MLKEEYHKKIVEYYNVTENAYKDSWDLENSLAIHYGYWDKKVRSFRGSLIRMNEVMAEAAVITGNDKVLDAGCGIGGSSIFLATKLGCQVTGISLSERQVQQAMLNAQKRGVGDKVDFKVMNYCDTGFDEGIFDIVWGCESICYASDKNKFISEAFRLLRPGGRLVVADGFVSNFENNDQPVIRQWLDGWQVNYLETPQRFSQFMKDAGFTDINYKDISEYASRSSLRLLRFYYLATLYLIWKKLSYSERSTEMQRKNIRACRHQYYGMKRGLWQYGLFSGKKP